MSSYTPPENIQEILNNLPTSPGVYQMFDRKGTIIYIGKAKNLRNRVRSYFQPGNVQTKVQRIRERVVDIKIIVLEDEVAALTAEAQLIRHHKPRYNVIWKDDKRYPYIMIRTRDAFPKVLTTRQVNRKDGNRYFGPYSSSYAIRLMLDALRKAFPYLTCDREITGNDARACLYYDIKMCGGPCIGAQNQAEYRESINGLIRVLEGKAQDVLKELQTQMEGAAENLNFERAAVLRDRIQAIERVTNFQYRIADYGADQDVIGIAQDDMGVAMMALFAIRSGNMVGSETFPLVNIEDEETPEIIASFLIQYYEEAYEIPPEIFLPVEVPDTPTLEKWLSEKRNGRGKVSLKVPQRGEKKALVKQASETAAEQLNIFQIRQAKDTIKQEAGLRELQEALKLENPPTRMECYDISTLQGTNTVASRVVFVQGTPQKSEYRKFNIRTIAHEGPDDYQSMRETLTRRFKRYIESVENPEALTPGKVDKDETWRLLPDLLIIDGGKGQLGVAVEVLKEFELIEHIPVIGLAKRFEEVYLPDQAEPIILPRKSEGLYLLQRIRDEAHRFAITAHRTQRQRKGVMSRLEAVPGIGPSKRKALLKAFNNDIEAIRGASIEELIAVAGITAKLAEQIKATLD